MTDEKKLFTCTLCLGNYPLEGGLLAEHLNGAEECGGSRRMPGSVHPFFAEMGASPIRVEQLRPRGFGKTAEAEADRAAWHAQEALTDAFVSNAYRIHVQHTEQTLKEMIQGALKLVEDNPRNEPMRTEISRPAVERMLAEDLAEALVPETVLAQDLAKKLFDAGWRPTIDRLVR